MARAGRWIVGLAITAALLAPVALDRDGFPLSTYPMYATSRGETIELVTARAIDADGRPIRLSIDDLARTDDPLIARSQLRRQAAADPDALCRAIAERSGAATVTVVREQHDVLARAEGEPSVLASTTLAECDGP
ncbi:MAG: hypothetical protein HKN26_02740 [Acidimicrobiales bacterium]|nr:hypothetical protein [Acidimicrobiales bacterium]